MATVTINGTGYDGSNGSEPVYSVAIELTAVNGGPVVETLIAYDWESPDSGVNDSPGVVVDEWSATQIVVRINGRASLLVARVLLRDAEFVYEVPYAITPDDSLEYIGGPDYTVTYDWDTDLLTITSSDPSFALGQLIYGYGESPTGTPPWGFEMTIDDVSLLLISPTELQFPSFRVSMGTGDDLLKQLDFYDPYPTIVGMWQGEVPIAEILTYPLIESVCSPAANRFRFYGERFLTAGAGVITDMTLRMEDYATGALLNGPDLTFELVADPPGSWSVITHTDTIIEVENPSFSSEEPSAGPGDFVVTGAAFHGASMAYYEPPENVAFSVPVDGSGVGCGPLPTAILLDLNSSGDNSLEIVADGWFTANPTEGAYSFRVYDTDDVSYGPYLVTDPEVTYLSDQIAIIEDAAFSGKTIYIAEVNFQPAGMTGHMLTDLDPPTIP